MVRKRFCFNEFGPSLVKWANAFLRDSACLHGPAVPRHRCPPARAIPDGLQGLSPVSKPPRIAGHACNNRRIVASEGLPSNRQHPASTWWLLAEIRLLWD